MKEGESCEASKSLWSAAPRGTVAGLSRPSSYIEVGVKLGKLRVDWEEIFVKVEANVSIGSHETFKSLEDMVLICAAARGPMPRFHTKPARSQS
jgi:hypothetical protein